MDEKFHQIDPDGDVELTLRDADPTFAAWDDNERVLISHPRDLPVHNRISKLQTKSRTEERTIEKPNAYASFNLVDPGRGSVPAPEYYTSSDDESENGSENEPETEDLLPESSTAFEDMPRSDGEAELIHEEPSATSRSTTPQPEKKEKIRMKLSSKHLVLASNYFRKMFVGPWKESITSSGKCHTVDATGWDTEAMLILMNIIHGRARKVPRSIDLEMLAKIATLVDYYDCHEVVILYAECWIRELDTELPNDYGRDLVLWLWISWVFGREIIFETMTRIAALECRGPLQTLGLPIPQHIVAAEPSRANASSFDLARGSIISFSHQSASQMEQDSRSNESRERAVSSEPSSTRPNPFVDEDDHSARKRRRTSLLDSRSRSVETLPPQQESEAEAQAADGSTMKIDTPDQAAPSTPPQSDLTESSPAEPHSSRVTINLRNIDNAEDRPTPTSPTKGPLRAEDIKASVEGSEVEMEQAPPIMDDIESSASAAASSDIPVIVVDDDEDDDDDVELISVQSTTSQADINAILSGFPYYSPDTSLYETMTRLIQFFAQRRFPNPPTNDQLLTHWIAAQFDDVIFQLSSWFDRYLHYASADLPAADVVLRSAGDVRLLWQAMPDLFSIIYSRRNVLAKSPSTRDLTAQLFYNLPKLAAHFVKLDLRFLARLPADDQSNDFELVSPGLLAGLASITLRRNDDPHLQNGLLTDNVPDNAVLLDIFQKESCQEPGYEPNDGSMLKLARLAESVSSHCTRYPRKSMEYLTRICALGESISNDSELQQYRASTSTNGLHVRSQRNAAVAIRMFKAASASLCQVVDKSVNHMTADLVPPIMNHLGSLLRFGLLGSSRNAMDMIAVYRNNHPTLPEAYVVDAVLNEWRFEQLSKMITSRQMQLRVVSLSHLAGQLVFEWKRCQDHQREEGSEEYLRHLSRGLTSTGLVDYLLGPTCHPEIILDGFNIIGFLAVTETYEPRQTDLFWQTMTTTQDPRISEALVRMMAKTANHFGREPLAYLIEKMQSLHVEAFTLHMRELFETVIKAVTQKQIDLISSVAKLCLRLVQESSINNRGDCSEHTDTFEFAASKLYELLNSNVNPMLRQELLQECLDDISTKSHSTAGSLHVLYRLIRPALNRELAVLVAEYDFPRLLAEELNATIVHAREIGSDRVYATPLGAARRALIEHIIAEHGALIEPKYVEQFWRLLVGEAAASQDDRLMGWNSLNLALKAARPDNPFLSLCLQEHLPKLSPELYCPGTLDFIREALTPLANDAIDTALDEERASDHRALEILWQIILKARPQTIETQAIGILVNDIYVKGKSINSFPLDRARKVHLTLVNRCFQQMADAAKGLLSADGTNHGNGNGDRMATSTKDELLDHELKFTRSLFVLREFVAVLQDKSHHFAAPDLRSLMLQSPSLIEGEPADLKVQSFDGNQQTDVKPLTIGRQNTAASLLASIREATGFNNYRIFYRGALLTPTEDQICKSLEELNIHNGLILVKKESDAVSTPINIKPGASPLEIEILGHFKALSEYLSMEEKLAKEIYYFLVKLPADGSILAAFESPDTSYLDVFPLGEPFKCLYTIHALREYLNTRRLRFQAMQISPQISDSGQKVVPGQEDLFKAMSLLVAAIEDLEVVGRCPTESLKMELSFHLVETFVQLLSDSVDAQRVVQFLTPKLQERLMALLSDAAAAQRSQYTIDVMNRALEALLECCSRSTDFWELFRQQPSVTNIIRNLLFTDSRLFVRKNTGKLIKDKCTYSHSDSGVTPLQFAEMFWPIVFELLPQAVAEPSRCEEVLNLSSLLMPKLAEAESPALDLKTFLGKCEDLILSYESTEDVSHPDRLDIVAHGLVCILHSGMKLAAQDGNLPFSVNFTRKLFHKHLFPSDDLRGPLVPRVILSQSTRRTLIEIVTMLTEESDDHYMAVLQDLNTLVSYGYSGKSTEQNPYMYDLPQGFERSKAVRAPSGYAGLRNLSNTCYLNSLLTQLFMNPNFRRFMMQVLVLDPGAHQLLRETQSLFADLQDSIRRSIDPSACVAQIMTYDETPIDIHTQMDVDEFYNLLFDRWESQMPSSRAKQKFRSIYGGQLVQQVKSKECEHISERIEPFSAIQCDIKGIASLQESLQAYVDGEIMEGDNKYKCERCNRHVDAVKRACLKEVPDDVIFHLKRFSFDLRTLQRNKINDHFAFPKEIDLGPFKVEHLTNSSGEPESDIFELVGVLVHSGTAESGHYYSYIRERPSSSSDQSWFEFNDDTVSAWDPTNLEGSCFGGKDAASRFDGGVGFEKVYSAYMLFYQRSSSLKQDHELMRQAGTSGPVRVGLKPELEMNIRVDNWNIVHRYCTNDPSHISFAKSILARAWQSPCSESHKVEYLAMHVALGHLDQIASRAKDVPDFPLLHEMVSQACQRCVNCSVYFCDYFRARTEALRMLLLRNADATVRHSTGSLLIAVLKIIKESCPNEYEPLEDDSDLEIIEARSPVLITTVGMFNKLWESFHTSLRAWPEFFHTMAAFASMGKLEASALLDENYLVKLIMIITADATDQQLPSQYARLATTLFRRQRPPSYEAIIALVDILMGCLEPEADNQDFIENPRGRLQLALEDAPVPYTVDEVNEIHREWPRSNNSIFVDKLIQLNQNPKSTEYIFRRLMAFSAEMDRRVYLTLRFGITDSQQNAPPVAVYLRAAIFYVRWSTSEVNIQHLINHVCNQCQLLTNVEGMAYLGFFKKVFETQRRTEGRLAYMHIKGLKDIPKWAPALLGYIDPTVRSQAESFLEEALWQWGPDPEEFEEEEGSDERARELVTSGKRLTVACLSYLNDIYVSRNAQAPKDNVMPLQDAVQRGAAYFNDSNAAIHPELDLRYAELKPVLDELDRLMVDEIEEEASDWDNSAGSSELVDMGDL
ncbi:hypothetical protein SCAR479_08348 [Seiridium cardinale]|uniref:USP domain-containing protein n=1 Tax=Seiridium cardinale TaxID=138064 RepID=A0ABR2XN18_9PEZI